MDTLSDNRYCYPDTDVLINKLGIVDAELLSRAERDVTAIRQAEVSERFKFTDFGVGDLKRLHGHLFGDVYDWAGEFREIDIYKGYSAFVPAAELERRADEIFGELSGKSLLSGLGRDDFSREMAYFMADLNHLHPFREGNGRTQRVFATALAEHAGWELNLAGIPKMSLQSAMTTSHEHPGVLERMLRANVEPLPDNLFGRVADQGEMGSSEQRAGEGKLSRFLGRFGFGS